MNKLTALAINCIQFHAKLTSFPNMPTQNETYIYIVNMKNLSL